MVIEERKHQHEERPQKPPIPEHLAKLKIDITFDDNINQNDDDEDFIVEQQFNSSSEKPQSFTNTILENKNHLGLASCKLIKNYVENYKCLKEVAIVLKQFLARMGLNSPYHGK